MYGFKIKLFFSNDLIQLQIIVYHYILIIWLETLMRLSIFFLPDKNNYSIY